MANSLPPAALTEVLAALAEALGDSPHIEFLLRWVRCLCLQHGNTLQVRTPLLAGRSQALTKLMQHLELYSNQLCRHVLSALDDASTSSTALAAG